MSSATLSPSKQSRGRLIFCLLALFFALPIVVVTLMYKFEWHPQGAIQGELVTPPKPVVLPGGLLDAQGGPLDTHLLRDKWSMVYVSAECEEVCKQRLHVMRRLT